MATSMFNSFSNAFVAYLARRLCGDDHDQAILWLETKFVAGGDDGLQGDMDGEMYLSAVEMLGLKADFEVVHRGEWGVSFLSRNYTPAVWFGSNDSFCDIKRVLSKNHLCSKNMDARAMLYARAVTYYRSDRYTPLIARILRVYMAYLEMDMGKYVQTYGKKPHEMVATALGWWTLSNFERDYDWPQGRDASNFCDEYLEREIPEARVQMLISWEKICVEKIKVGELGCLDYVLASPLLVKPSDPAPAGHGNLVEITVTNEHWEVADPTHFTFDQSDYQRRDIFFKDLTKMVCTEGSNIRSHFSTPGKPSSKKEQSVPNPAPKPQPKGGGAPEKSPVKPPKDKEEAHETAPEQAGSEEGPMQPEKTRSRSRRKRGGKGKKPARRKSNGSSEGK